jgi:hypothetical protein
MLFALEQHFFACAVVPNLLVDSTIPEVLPEAALLNSGSTTLAID